MADAGRRTRARIRALAACDHCRLKKLKCEGGFPCGNCTSRHLECNVASRVKKPRPTKQRIRELEDENRRLLQQREGSEHISPPIASHDESQTLTSGRRSLTGHDGDSIQDESSLTPISHQSSRRSHSGTITKAAHCEVAAESPEKRIWRYHGPTSAGFDLSSHSSPQALDARTASRRWRDSAGPVLCAATADQRHLEPVNLAAGRLDFDGVEPDLAVHLLAIYWGRQMHCGFVVYRPVFMRDMACGGPYFSRLLLNAMYFSASKHSQRLEVRHSPDDASSAGWSFRRRFTELLADEFTKSSITTIQALLVMAVSLFSRCDERSASWLYAGNAFNMVVDLGLHVFPHVPPNLPVPEEYLELRNRVFWGAYIIDKTQSLFQGRPPILRASDTNLDLEFLDNYEEWEAFDYTSFSSPWPHGAVPLRNPSTFQGLCQLGLVMERILTNLYGGNYAVRDHDRFYQESISLQRELEEWRGRQPTYIDCMARDRQKPPPLPQHLTLLALYNVLIILLRRPLIAGWDHPSETSYRAQGTAHESFVACVKAADEIVAMLRLYERYYQPGRATFMFSYATYISATIHVRAIALSQNDAGAYRSLSCCLDALEQHRRLYEAVNRMRGALDSLMQKLGVRLRDPDDGAAARETVVVGQVRNDQTLMDRTNSMSEGQAVPMSGSAEQLEGFSSSSWNQPTFQQSSLGYRDHDLLHVQVHSGRDFEHFRDLEPDDLNIFGTSFIPEFGGFL